MSPPQPTNSLHHFSEGLVAQPPTRKPHVNHHVSNEMVRSITLWHLPEGPKGAENLRLCDVQPRHIVAFSEFGSVLLDFIHGFKMLQVFSSTQEMDRNGLISKMLGETAKPPSCRGCTVALLSFDTQIASTCPFGQPFVSSPIWALCHGRAADSCHIHVLPRGISERLLGVKSVQREIDLKLYHLYIYIINTCRNKKPLENYDPFFSVSHALIISAAHQTRK